MLVYMHVCVHWPEVNQQDMFVCLFFLSLFTLFLREGLTEPKAHWFH